MKHNMKHKTLGKKEIKEYNELIRAQHGISEFFNKNDLVSLVDDWLFTCGKQICFFLRDGKILPTLKLLEVRPLLKTVTVDMGSLKFLIKGADVFRPGIVAIDDGIQEGQLVRVLDQNNHKPIAIGYALLDTENMRKQTRGKVITNVHHRGDAIWNLTLD
ncbi:RNA-binding protein [Candidatus Woesearchaeota archaeon]|nr:RNA-binding protein [Candidatus Woesearchaeota archaeon]